jgi:hypothetical protein
MAWTGTAPASALATGAGAASTTSTTVGRFSIVYLEYNPLVADLTNPNSARWAMSYVDTSGTLRIGLARTSTTCSRTPSALSSCCR